VSGAIEARVTIRPAEPGDAEATRSIYNPEVLESTVTFDLRPRSLEEQRAWLAEHSGGHLAIVAVDAAGGGAPDVVGFGSLSPYRSRPAYSTTVEDSVYVRRDRQGEGIGGALLTELVTRATAHGFHAMIARIVGDHEASIALHQACGFETIGTEREVGRKFNRWLDVVLMQRLL
jgi:phosphinothricin acetyltransferase